jgi:hypothetical protein
MLVLKVYIAVSRKLFDVSHLFNAGASHQKTQNVGISTEDKPSVGQITSLKGTLK